ncbi:spindle and kinetochore-associated protein 3 isoform X2 [Bubalus kerabau]|uniref:spindle and kinetochore-associated protein 3 isoform X2 n=1 Tax=Bubalus bubalis TaxID=89462 RepID=UPI001D124B58|nr:spindle and kinetochore-associated protein 3 isoform X2 [Bubalus bubalis]XP_055398529.1 spindle and kinetochore-associated protein 3 isoform X2 [Bubalus carabanensis]
MDPIRGFCGKLRSLAVTLDSETARLQRALEGEDSVDEQEVTDSKPESSECERPEKPDVKDDLLDSAAASTSVSEKSPRSPQLSDFGLERYIVSQVLPNPPQAVNNQKEEPKILTPFSKHSLVKTPKCALKMDDFECVTPKLEHFGISEYTMCLNDDYTIGLKNVKTNSETIETEPVPNDNVFATPGLITQPLGKNNAEHTHSPLAPTFCTPGLKVPSTKTSTAMVSTNSSSNDLETKESTSLVSNSDECFENFADPSSPTISSYENLLKTPTPPEVTTIPEDIRQILSKYNSNLASPVAVRAVSPINVFLPRHGGQNMRDASNKENW